MIYALRGYVHAYAGNMLILRIESTGIYLSIMVPQRYTFKPNQKVMLFTSLHVSEKHVKLFGFMDQKELLIFDALNSVQGIGPSISLNILSHYSPKELASIVKHEDVHALSKVKGVGRKLARKIVFELKEKLPFEVELDRNITYAMEVLTSLGMDRSEARELIMKALGESESRDTQELVKYALRIRGR